MHTHLYELNEDWVETEPMHSEPGHVHALPHGELTSGPKPLSKKPGQPWEKMDSSETIGREGANWVIRSSTGHKLDYHKDCGTLRKKYPNAKLR